MENTNIKTLIPIENILKGLTNIEWVEFADKNYLPMHYTFVDGLKYYFAVYQNYKYEATINGFIPKLDKGAIN